VLLRWRAGGRGKKKGEASVPSSASFPKKKKKEKRTPSFLSSCVPKGEEKKAVRPKRSRGQFSQGERKRGGGEEGGDRSSEGEEGERKRNALSTTNNLLILPLGGGGGGKTWFSFSYALPRGKKEKKNVFRCLRPGKRKNNSRLLTDEEKKKGPERKVIFLPANGEGGKGRRPRCVLCPLLEREKKKEDAPRFLPTEKREGERTNLLGVRCRRREGRRRIPLSSEGEKPKERPPPAPAGAQKRGKKGERSGT